jgi:hypothetical protein
MASLAAYLKDHVEKVLLDLQQTGYKPGNAGVDNVVDDLIDDFANPNKIPHEVVSWTLPRLKAVSDELKTRIANNQISPLVVPRLGSMTVEWALEACVLFWIYKGQPSPANQLDPSVQKFVKRQTKLIASLMGDQ